MRARIRETGDRAMRENTRRAAWDRKVLATPGLDLESRWWASWMYEVADESRRFTEAEVVAAMRRGGT